eukprot:m.15148 g.15148  ORF g.15148 m.15148 type:complete len:819 (+) comp10635_c0_seq2:397-2853(+)
MMGEPEVPAGGAEIHGVHHHLISLKSTLRASKGSAFIEPAECTSRVSGGDILGTSSSDRLMEITPAHSQTHGSSHSSEKNLTSNQDSISACMESSRSGVQKSISKSVETVIGKSTIDDNPTISTSPKPKVAEQDEGTVLSKQPRLSNGAQSSCESQPNTGTKQPCNVPIVPLKKKISSFMADTESNMVRSNAKKDASGSESAFSAGDGTAEADRSNASFIVRRSNPARPIFPPSVGEDSTLARPMDTSLDDDQGTDADVPERVVTSPPASTRTATIITSELANVASPGGSGDGAARPTMITTPATLSPFGAAHVVPSTSLTGIPAIDSSKFSRHVGIEILKPGQALPPGSHLQAGVHIPQVVPASVADVIKQSVKLQTQKMQAAISRKAAKSSGVGGSKPHDRSADRIMRSNFFNQIHVGDSVQVIKNQRAGHHDVTNRNPSLMGNCGKVVAVPVYPSTWLTVRLDSTNQVIKVRTSQIQKLERGVPLAKHFSNDPLPTMRKKKRASISKQGAAGGNKRASAAAAKKAKSSKKKKRTASNGRSNPTTHLPPNAMIGSNFAIGMQYAPKVTGTAPMSPGMNNVAGMYNVAQAVQCGASPLSPSARLINMGIPAMNSPHAFVAGRPPLSPFGIRSADMSKDATFQYLDSMYGRDDAKTGAAVDHAGLKYMGGPMSTSDGNFLYQNASPEAMPFSQSSYAAMGDARDQDSAQQNPHFSPMAVAAGFMMLPQTPTSMGGSEMYYYPSVTTQASAHPMYNPADATRFNYASSLSPDRPLRLSTADHQQNNCETPSAMETLSNVAALTPRQKIQPESSNNESDE